jgi:hypothetical protein
MFGRGPAVTVHDDSDGRCAEVAELSGAFASGLILLLLVCAIPLRSASLTSFDSGRTMAERFTNFLATEV